MRSKEEERGAGQKETEPREEWTRKIKYRARKR